LIDNPSYQDFATHDDSAYPELWDGCVGAWAPCLGPSGGNLFDWSGFNNHGVLTGFNLATGWQASQGRYSLLHSSSYVKVANPRVLALSDLTLSAWIYPTSTGTGAFRSVVSKKALPDSAGPANFWLGLNNTNNTFAFYHFRPNESDAVFTTYQVPVNTWTHVAATVRGVSLVLYANGMAVTSATMNFAPLPDTNNLSIGKYGNSIIEPQYFVGNIDDVIIYNRAISATKMLSLYQIGRGGIYQPRRRRKAYFGQRFNAAWARGSNVIIQPSVGVA
jgi:hypothetical protein